MRCGTRAQLQAALQTLGLSGRPNTVFVERVNLRVRRSVAGLALRTWNGPRSSPTPATPGMVARLLPLHPPACVLAGRVGPAHPTWWSTPAPVLPAANAGDGSRIGHAPLDSAGTSSDAIGARVCQCCLTNSRAGTAQPRASERRRGRPCRAVGGNSQWRMRAKMTEESGRGELEELSTTCRCSTGPDNERDL